MQANMSNGKRFQPMTAILDSGIFAYYGTRESQNSNIHTTIGDFFTN